MTLLFGEMHLGNSAAGQSAQERYLFAAKRDAEVDLVLTDIVRQRAFICPHTPHVPAPLGQQRFGVVRIEIDVQMYHLNPFVQRETGVAHARRCRFGGDDRDGVLRMCGQPVKFLGQHTLHTAGIIQMRDAIEDVHGATSFFLICEIPVTIHNNRRLQVTRRGSKSSGARG